MSEDTEHVFIWLLIKLKWKWLATFMLMRFEAIINLVHCRWPYKVIHHFGNPLQCWTYIYPTIQTTFLCCAIMWTECTCRHIQLCGYIFSPVLKQVLTRKLVAMLAPMVFFSKKNFPHIQLYPWCSHLLVSVGPINFILKCSFLLLLWVCIMFVCMNADMYDMAQREVKEKL